MNLRILASLFFLLGLCGCQTTAQRIFQPETANIETRALDKKLPDGIRLMLENAVEQTKTTKSYDPNYRVIAYPMGDVPPETGVCTDVVIRAMRGAKVDLQKAVHEDMRQNFSIYPKKWGLKRADSNIDHRRVPNLQTYFTRQNKSLKISNDAKDYQPGDIVAWDLNGKGMTHIGVVSNFYNETTGRYLIIHNIGAGAASEDVLFDWKIIGHYRYF